MGGTGDQCEDKQRAVISCHLDHVVEDEMSQDCQGVGADTGHLKWTEGVWDPGWAS